MTKRKALFSLGIVIIALCLTQMRCFTPYSSSNVQNSEFFNLKSNAEVNKEWDLIWGGNKNDYSYTIATDPSDNVYFGGYEYSFDMGDGDFFLFKYNSAGVQIWNVTWGGTESDSCDGISVDSSNNIYCAACTESYGVGGYDQALLKFDSSGSLQWFQTWGASGTDYVNAIAIDSADNIYIGGTTHINSLDLYCDVSLVKFDPSGQQLWNRTWLNYGSERCAELVIDSMDNVIIAGGTGSGKVLLIKYDTYGNELWNATWKADISHDDTVYSAVIDSSDNILLTGSNYYDILLLKFNSSGDYLWHQYWGGPNIDRGYSISLDKAEEIFITGDTESFGSGGYDAILIKFNKSGGYQWHNLWGGGLHDRARALVLDSSDNMYLTGYTESYGAGLNDVFLVKYSPVYQITIEYPNTNQIFGIRAPEYKIKINSAKYNYTWYRINQGLNNYFTHYSGIINQTAWDLCTDGQITITFYAQSITGSTISKTITIEKDSAIHIISPTEGSNYGRDSPLFQISLIDWDLCTIWYSLNNGDNYTVYDLTGVINQSAWVECDDGNVNVSFFSEDPLGKISFDEVSINKDTSLIPKNSFAVIIGIEDYPGSADDLQYCRDDANSIYNILRARYKFQANNIILLLDSQATLNAIINAFYQINSNINQDDIFFFYFSGHGGGYPFEYLCPYDSLPSNPGNLLYDDDLNYYLGLVDCSEQYIILDACNSGGMIDESKKESRLFITACQDDEECWESSAVHHGVFTHFFLRSLDYASDSNGDGAKSMEEQYTYTYDHTVDYTTQWGSVFHPDFYDGIAGQAVLFPSLGSLSMNMIGTELYFSFYLYGHGAIQTLDLTMCSVAENITLYNKDLRKYSLSNTGFGFYSGVFDIGGTDNITSYELLVKIMFSPTESIIISRSFGDTDEDGLTDIVEIKNGLNPQLNDTDNDGMLDGEEVNTYFTDPLINDTDSDGLLDGEEVNDYFTDPLLNDTDTDGLLDGEEVNEHNTNPLLEDTDGDELTDFEEVNQYFTEPDNSDTDVDGMHDGFEVLNGLNPFNDDTQDDLDNDEMVNIDEYNAGTEPDDPDTDDDGMEDGYEYDNGLDLFNDDTGLDYDNDNLTNIEEYLYGSFANNPDSDGDTMPDGWEYENNLNLLLNDSALDPDEDSLANLLEFQHHTDPNLNDTDGDGWLDGEEVLTYDTDPLDPDDYPTFPEGIPGYEPILILFVIALFILLLSRKLTKLYKN